MSRTSHNSRLESQARKIVERLGGRWRGSKGMCCCPAHDDRTPSLSVTIGRKAILFHCFAGCTNDDVLAALGRDGLDARELFDGDHQSDEALSRPTGPDRNALRLWKQARALSGSPAELYLRGRSIEIASPDLRYHERTPLGPKREVRFLPAMLAAVRSDEGVIALHRTFLDSEGATLARFSRPKRALGSLQAGAVRLAAPRGGHLGLAEGVETALSAMQIFGIPCWATLGNERFGIVAIPESVRVLHLFLDADEGGDLAQERGCEAYATPGRRIAVERPRRGGYDWADVLHRRQSNKARQSVRGEEAPA